MYPNKTNWPETIPQFLQISTFYLCVDSISNTEPTYASACPFYLQENRKELGGGGGGGSPKTDTQLPQIPQALGRSQDADQNENVWIQKELFYSKKSYIFTF
jgi:hypothetical protein